MPREMISTQTVDERQRCVLHLAWSSPSDIAVEHVMTYMIVINGNNSVNKTNSDNSTRNLIAHSMCTCGPHTVSISAVNICHRVGQSTPNVTLHPEPLSNSSACPAPGVTYVHVTTEPSELTDCDRIPKKCKLIICLYDEYWRCLLHMFYF